MCRKYSKAIQELSFVSLMRITTSIPLKIKLKENMVCLQIGDVLAWLKADVKQDVQPSMIGWKILKESIIMPLHFVKTQWCFLVLIFSFIKDLFLHTFRLAVCDYFLLWICLVKQDFFFLFAVQYVQKLFTGNSRTQICLLDENNYVYSIRNKVNGLQGFTTNWRCTSERHSKCQARCSTFNDRLKSFKGEHNHAPTFCESTMILLGSDFQFQ